MAEVINNIDVSEERNLKEKKEDEVIAEVSQSQEEDLVQQIKSKNEISIGFTDGRELPPLSPRKKLRTFSEILAKAIDDLHKGKLESSASVDVDENDVTGQEEEPFKEIGQFSSRLQEKRDAGIPHVSIIEREAKRREVEAQKMAGKRKAPPGVPTSLAMDFNRALQ